jgi:hypothetical protein
MYLGLSKAKVHDQSLPCFEAARSHIVPADDWHACWRAIASSFACAAAAAIALLRLTLLQIMGAKLGEHFGLSASAVGVFRTRGPPKGLAAGPPGTFGFPAG